MFLDCIDKISSIALEMSKFMSNIDIENINYRLTCNAINEHLDAINELNKQDIFMPLMYITVNDVFYIEDVEEFILNVDIKDFYIERIREIWTLGECGIEGIMLKEEIIDNLNQNNYYSSYILLITLFESYINNKYDENFDNKRYKKIKNKLKEEVFDPLYILDYFDKFIANNIYSKSDCGVSTSRHNIIHANALYYPSLKDVMNLIFIFDLIYWIMDNK